MFAQNGRKRKKKVVKLHGKPFIRLMIFPLATEHSLEKSKEG